MIDGSPASRVISLFGGSEVCLPDSATATQLRSTSSCALRLLLLPGLLSTVPNFTSRLQPVDAVLRTTFVQKLCYKLLSVVSFTFVQIFYSKLSSLLNGVKVGALA